MRHGPLAPSSHHTAKQGVGMKSKTEKKDLKRPYVRPELITIELAVEEVLGTGCKLAGGGLGQFPPTCLSTACVLTSGS
jgi:hypothetical protein